MTDNPQWLTEVAAADQRIETARDAMARAGDDRARAIARGVAAYPRGEGRPAAAQILDITVGQVDVALRRARETDRVCRTA